ncbi:MAG: hypothetical protein HZA28_05165 [Candidatus Omnitrophica bacterium]|nr:hypothetical protein [Candidatus Omnitrophota bacterium]
MTNRFTATEKWNDPWFCGLPPPYKLFWVYLCDTCNHAGIWNVNWPLVKFHCGQESFDLKIFTDRVVVISTEKWFIKKFVLFQQKILSLDELNPENNAHRAIINILQKEGILRGLPAPDKGLSRGPGKGNGKVKVKKDDGTERSGKTGKGIFLPPALEEIKAFCIDRKNQIDPETFFDFYQSQGWRVGNNKMKDWRAAVRTWERRNKDQGRPAGGNGKVVNWDRLIEDRLGKIATDGMIKAMMREMPQILWWKIEQFLKKRYRGSNGTAFLRIESELIREKQDAGNLNSAICEGKTEAATVAAP